MAILPEDRDVLIRYLDFLETEIADFKKFSKMDWKKYNEDRDARRNLERWIENIVNCSIDIAKVLLLSEGRGIPTTYKEILRALGATPYFDETFGNEISRWAGLRNIITHEYLDISWSYIKKFLSSAEPTFKQLVEKVRGQVT